MQNVSLRNPWSGLHPFTRHTYALIDAYAAAGRIPAPRAGYFEGDASAIAHANDMLLQDGTQSWDACDASLVRAMLARGGFDVIGLSVAKAILAFRCWLSETERGGTYGIDGLFALVAELEQARGVNRAERRWRARIERRMHRR